MGFFSDLFQGVASSVRTVVHVVTDVAATASSVIKYKYRELRQKYADINVQELKKTRFDQLKGINDQIIELEAKCRRDGSLSEYDQERVRLLEGERQKLRQRIENAKEFIAAGEIASSADEYSVRDADLISPNELTRLGGQVMMGKLCPRCQRPQVIRWKSSVREPGIRDLFWGCTGLFVKDERGNSLCTKTQAFTLEDRRIFSGLVRPGLELPSTRLNEIILKPAASQLIKNKLSDAVHEVSENYLCPVHHEPMELVTNASAADLLDLYSLKCRRCQQRIKIKSATQLDAVLQSYDQKGLF